MVMKKIINVLIIGLIGIILLASYLVLEVLVNPAILVVKVCADSYIVAETESPVEALYPGPPELKRVGYR